MASRGRGRGRGAKRTFNRDQLNALGVVGNEPLSQLSNPPPLYTPLLRSAAPLESSEDLDYALEMKTALINFMQLSYSFLKLPEKSSDDLKQKLELPEKEITHEWRMFPSELRPKLKAKRKIKRTKKEESVLEKLERLEKMESDRAYNIDKVKTEPNAEDVEGNENVVDEEDEEDEEKEEDDEEQMDEEIDDGTDYGNNYFDNGDSYCNDEDDNLDDGPVY
ncbi:DNA-directed RNA polymerase III subunit RPC7-like [Coccinella septempunctata]|uniref:DNA-directed RNA polymerase III subunit RPC7-like n=1 Tax=Coccinella septempunctata TaxID=41139 RepID=UPI001D05E65F|nr:DNA-directed RNA polymerase III subunit RPC7-like [Coccinella septempunctata]